MKILDATCGTRTIWMEKHNRDTTYIDIRPEVKPDIVADATHTPFPDCTFDIILFDPPYKNFHHKGIYFPKNRSLGRRRGPRYAFIYGKFTTAYILDFVRGAFAEFYRILKDDGLVFMKWNDTSISLLHAMRLRGNFVPIFGQNFNKIKAHSTTAWICFRKDLDGKQAMLMDGGARS